MRRPVLVLAFATLAACTGIACAEPTPAPVRAEIDGLLARLQASGCSFERNGTWYDGGAARDHLLKKLDYLEDHGTVATTEDFIDTAASASSMSGRPYHVRCGMGAPVESREWLGAQLGLMRAGRPASAASSPSAPSAPR